MPHEPGVADLFEVMETSTISLLTILRRTDDSGSINCGQRVAMHDFV
jgi:hypothetical protein